MPTVTVLAWCLMASTGPGELLDGRGSSAAVRSSTTTLGRADLAVLDLVGVERRDAERRSGSSDAEPHRGAAPRGGRRRRRLRRPSKKRRGQRLERRAQPGEQRSSPSPAAARTAASMAAAGLAQRPGRGVDGERRLVAEQVADHRRRARRPSVGCVGGHGDDLRGRRRSAPRPRWRSRSARPCGPGRSRPPWPRRRRWSPARPAAHTRISGSDERSMCFLSSVASQAIDL